MKKSSAFTAFFTLSILCAVTGISLSSTFLSSDYYFLLSDEKVSALRVMLIVQFFASVLGSSVLKKRRNPALLVIITLLASLVVTVYSGLLTFSIESAKLFPYFIIPLFSLIVLVSGIICIVSYFVKKDATSDGYEVPKTAVKRSDETSFPAPSANDKVVEASGLIKTCTQCGAKTEISQNGKYTRCPYCGTYYKVKDKDEFFD